MPVLRLDGARVGHIHRTVRDGHEHWIVVTTTGYVSPFLHPTAQDAAESLLALAGGGERCHLDVGLTGALAGLGREFGPMGVALAAAYLTDRQALIDRLASDVGDGHSSGRLKVDRDVLARVLAERLGPRTAAEVLTGYDKTTQHTPAWLTAGEGGGAPA